MVVRLRAPVRHSGSVPRLSHGLEMIAPEKAEFMLAISSRALFAVNRLRSRASLSSSSVQVGVRRASAHPKDGPQGSNGACARGSSVRTGVCLHLLQDGRSKALRENTLTLLTGSHCLTHLRTRQNPLRKYAKPIDTIAKLPGGRGVLVLCITIRRNSNGRRQQHYHTSHFQDSSASLSR